MDFVIADVTFAKTGPVTFTFILNGKPFDQVRYAKPGAHSYQKPVPASLLKPGEVVTAAIEQDNIYVSDHGKALGFILIRAGFKP